MPEYLLLKRGLYYRPNNRGYTGIRDEAGRYDESDAYPDGGVTAIHEFDAPYFAPACWNDVKVSHLMGLIADAENRFDLAVLALHDAIVRPMGVVPDSADRFYDPVTAQKAREWYEAVK